MQFCGSTSHSYMHRLKAAVQTFVYIHVDQTCNKTLEELEAILAILLQIRSQKTYYNVSIL